MAEAPSWHNSTLSQTFIGSCVLYGLILVIVSVGLIWCKLDVEIAKLIVGWVSAFQVAITSAYLTARKVNGEGKPVEPPKP